jgi:hypothetical protein
MAFVRTMKRENPFVQIDKGFIGCGSLSLKSTGLLTYILSKPDGWQIRMNDIQKRFLDGETATRTAMNELRKAGYVNRFRERGGDGRFGDYIYEVYERPDFNPKRENPEQGNPEQEKPIQENHGHSNNDFSNNDFSNNESSNNHHQIPGFNQRQSNLIHQVIQEQKIDDDDLKVKLIHRLKGRDFKHKKYIHEALETVKEMVEPNKKDQLLPDWAKPGYKLENSETPEERRYLALEMIEFKKYFKNMSDEHAESEQAKIEREYEQATERGAR